MSIQVNEFHYVKGQNDEEYIKLLKEALKSQEKLTAKAIARLKEQSIEPKRGEWLWSPRDADGTVSGCCSNCSFSHLFIGGHTAQYKFCPNCGADMRKESE